MMPWLKLVRWYNLIFTAIIIWLMEKMVVVAILNKALFYEQLPGWMFYMLMLAVVFIAAGGYAINDYFDVKIDVINRPEKLIVTRSLSKQQAMICHQLMTAIGVILGLIVSAVLKSWTLAIIFIFIPGLLWFYSSSYKRQFFVGNLIVATAAGITPMVIAFANVAYLKLKYGDLMNYTTITTDIYTWVGGFAFFAFLTTLSREIIKDLQDQIGDRELECHTLPIIIGEKWTKVVVSVLLLLILAFAFYAVYFLMPFGKEWGSVAMRYYIFGLFLPMICEFYLLFSAQLTQDYKNAQTLLKFIMLVGVLFSVVIRVML